MALTVVIAGGGTGGHVFPALALAEVIGKREPEIAVRFIGTEHGMESRLVPQAGYPFDAVPARPVVGRGPIGALSGLWTIARGTLRARRLLRQSGARLVIGVGGYASFPAVAAAASLRIPCALLSPDALPGRANRVLGRLARAVFVQFEEAESYFSPAKVYRLGVPVRPIPARRDASTVPGTVNVLILGGSQGASSVNRAIVGSLDRLPPSLRITHQTGERDAEHVRRAYAEAGVAAEVAAFLEDVPERLSRADMVVARAGIGTLSEICAAGVPSVLVPYPFAADDHQMRNARALERAGGCVIVRDAEATATLAEEIRALATNRERRRRMGEAARRIGTPDAADRIWKVCSGWLSGPEPRARRREQP